MAPLLVHDCSGVACFDVIFRIVCVQCYVVVKLIVTEKATSKCRVRDLA